MSSQTEKTSSFVWDIPDSPSLPRFTNQAEDRIKFSSELPSDPTYSTQSTTGVTTVTIPSFTATGRSYSYQAATPLPNNDDTGIRGDNNKKGLFFSSSSSPRHGNNRRSGGGGLEALNSCDSLGMGPANTLPIRYTDDSLISIPVLPEPFSPSISPSLTFKTEYKHDFETTVTEIPPTSSPSSDNTNSSPSLSPKSPQSPRSKFWRRSKEPSTISSKGNRSEISTPEITSAASQRQRGVSFNPLKLSSSSNSSSSLRSRKNDVEFVMKKVSRRTYLQHYAKDDQGRYTGTEEPAPDCILRCKEDLEKWRLQ